MRSGRPKILVFPRKNALEARVGIEPSLDDTGRYRVCGLGGDAGSGDPAYRARCGCRSMRMAPARPASQGTDGETPSLPDRPVARPPHLKWGILIGAKGRIIVVEHRLRLYRRVYGLGGDAGSGDPAYRARCGCRSMRMAPAQALPTNLRVRRRSLARLGRGRRSVGNLVRRDGRSVARDPYRAEPAAWHGGRAHEPSDPHSRIRSRRSRRN